MRAAAIERSRDGTARTFLVQLLTVFLAYFAVFLKYGCSVWPAVVSSAFLVALGGSVSPSAATGSILLRRIPNFDPSLPRLRDALGLMVLGAFGSALLSSLLGILSLYATGIQPYSGIESAWLVYWLGDSTGVLLVTPLVFTFPQLLGIRSRARIAELLALVALTSLGGFVVFGNLFPVQLDVFAFAVLPLVMWAGIDFGIAGATLSVFLIATIATILTAPGFGPFAANTAFTNAVLLDLLLTLLSVSGLALASVISERERAERERERLIRARMEVEARLRHAAVVESSDDAIVSEDLNAMVLSWNQAASRMFGHTEPEAIGRPISQLLPPELLSDEPTVLGSLRAGAGAVHLEGSRESGSGETIHLSSTISPLRDGGGHLVGTVRTIRDISERKRAEEALSRAKRKLVRVQEQERARIARELHDDIGQRLALLNLVVSDEGRGFDPGAVKEHPGIGLITMQERVGLVDGDLRVESYPGRGTTVHARVPITETDAPTPVGV